MFTLLAALFFAASVLVHGGAATVHSHWLDWQGLMLAGLLCLALGGLWPIPAPWKRNQQ